MPQEIRAFLIMVGAGFIIGLLYDIYRWVWLAKHPRSWHKDLGDLIFSLFASTIAITLLFYSNWGQLRFYIFIGMGLGIILYIKVVKGIITRLSK